MKYTSKWEPQSGFAAKFEPRGDERRSFETPEGEQGEMRVTRLSGGWSVVIVIDGECLYTTRGFGFTSKAKAKADASWRARALCNQP